MPTAAEQKKRVHVVFDEHAAEMIATLQKSTGKTMAEVLRDSIVFYDWARQQTENGDQSIAVVNHKTDRVREFVLPFRRVG
jgi:hypothetical protein